MQDIIPINQKLKKLIRSLHQKQARDTNELFLAEGEKICAELLKSEFDIELACIREVPSGDIIQLVNKFYNKGIPVYSTPKHQFEQLCDTKTPQGIIAVVNYREDNFFPVTPFISLDAVSDPGNVGTIIRTADWFGFKQIILGSGCADKYNPKTVRSSMGSIFKINIIETEDLLGFISENYKKYNIYGAEPNNGTDIAKFKPKGNFGIIFGSESHGISKEIEEKLNGNFSIPGNGGTESLNVAVAAGITLYHLSRNLAIR